MAPPLDLQAGRLAGRHGAAGRTLEEIREDVPIIEAEDVRQALWYAAWPTGMTWSMSMTATSSMLAAQRAKRPSTVCSPPAIEADLERSGRCR